VMPFLAVKITERARSIQNSFLLQALFIRG
jgi:hypothetical protein